MNENLKKWFDSLDKASQAEQIKKQSINLCKLRKSMDKALKAEIEYGFNRIGIRGGKFTTLNAKASVCSKMYYNCEEELKYMVKTL